MGRFANEFDDPGSSGDSDEEPDTGTEASNSVGRPVRGKQPGHDGKKDILYGIVETKEDLEDLRSNDFCEQCRQTGTRASRPWENIDDADTKTMCTDQCGFKFDKCTDEAHATAGVHRFCSTLRSFTDSLWWCEDAHAHFRFKPFDFLTDEGKEMYDVERKPMKGPFKPMKEVEDLNASEAGSERDCSEQIGEASETDSAAIHDAAENRADHTISEGTPSSASTLSTTPVDTQIETINIHSREIQSNSSVARMRGEGYVLGSAFTQLVHGARDQALNDISVDSNRSDLIDLPIDGTTFTGVFWPNPSSAMSSSNSTNGSGSVS